LTENGSKHAQATMCLLWVREMCDHILGDRISQKPSKGAFLGVLSVREQNEEERRHSRMLLLASVVAASQGLGLYIKRSHGSASVVKETKQVNGKG